MSEESRCEDVKSCARPKEVAGGNKLWLGSRLANPSNEPKR